MTPRRRYEVRGLLGEGAFGAVYLARAVGGGIQREVAIKVLHRERASNPALVGRLRDEARMLALIRHRAIVRVDDLVELDGDWSIVMEYVEGCDVAALLRGGALAPAVALAITEEVANALHAAWNQAGPDGAPLRLVHRDIKPGNVRVTAQGEVKLLDFGVARAEFAEREAGTTQTGFGTVTYMAPERYEGKDTHQGDIYSLGVFLFEMLTGVTPGKLAGDPDRQPPGRRYAEQWAYLAGLSVDLQALVAGMLAYDPDRRPTARDAARVIADIRREMWGERLEDWAARTVPAVLAEGSAAGRDHARTGTILTERSTPPPATAGRTGVRVLPWLAGGVVTAAMLAVVLVGAGAATWWVLGGTGEGPTATGAAPHPEVAGPPVAPLSAEVEQAPAGEPDSVVVVEAAAPSGAAAASSVPAAGEAPPRRDKGDRATPPPENPAAPTRRAPASEPTVEHGRLRLAGDRVQATFTGPNGPVEAGSVPPGTYVAEVIFEADGSKVTIRDIVVAPGKVTWLTCKADFGSCAAAAAQ